MTYHTVSRFNAIDASCSITAWILFVSEVLLERISRA